MASNGIVYAPDTPNWAQIRNIEYSYQASLIADNTDYLRRFMISTQALQTEALLAPNAQLAEVNHGILGVQQQLSSVAEAVDHGMSEVIFTMQEGLLHLGAQLQEHFSALTLELQRQHAVMQGIALLLSTSLEGEAREIRQAAMAALREGCAPDAFDQDSSLREALHLFRLTIAHPMGMRDYVAWFNIGWLVWKLDGDLQYAEKAFATAVRQSLEKKDAYHTMAARHLAYIRYLQGNTAGAYQGITIALQNNRDDAEAQYTLLLVAAQAQNLPELTATFRQLIAEYPDWLAACLAEPELNAYAVQLQPVLDALVAQARAALKATVTRANAKIGEADVMAKAARRPTLLQAATYRKVDQIKSRMADVKLGEIDWPTLHQLVGELDALCASVEEDVDQIRHVLPAFRTMTWVTIPEGEFLYGDKNTRKHLPRFEMMASPVTVRQYRIFCTATGRPMPSAPAWGWQDDHPVVNVTWDDAAAFAAWAGLSLPTEIEWEKAARGTDRRMFPWGNKWDPTKCCHSFGTARTQLLPVGVCAEGASPYHVLDMAGNVWEWCHSWYDRNPQGRVLRGGSWRSHFVDALCVTHREMLDPAQGRCDVGFRCVACPRTSR